MLYERLPAYLIDGIIFAYKHIEPLIVEIMMAYTPVRILSLALIMFLSTGQLRAQVQTPRYVAMNGNTNGYFEYLPEGYNPASNEKYPLLLFIHGQGDLGNGSASNLSSLLTNGPSKEINEGNFPSSFIVNGNTFRFIVISPQFKSRPSSSDINSVLDFLESNYKIDKSRIYLTGTSMGGGVVWDYTTNPNTDYIKRLAALVPVCGQSTPDRTKARVISNFNLPVWALHNNDDPTVPVSNTNNYIAYINEAPAPNPAARKTIFNDPGHDAWTKSYSLSYQENGMNIYKWMLQFANFNSVLPVQLSDYSASERNGNSIMINWSTTSEVDNQWFVVEYSADGYGFQELGRISGNSTSKAYEYQHLNPGVGPHFYRLRQLDKDGKETLFSILKVNAKDRFFEQMKLFPVPSTTILNIAFKDVWKGELKLSVIDANGRTLYNATHLKKDSYFTQSIDTQQLLPGIYVIQVNGSGINRLAKFLKN